jgi:hypothetical protein
MMVSVEQIEGFLREMGLKFFCDRESGDVHWLMSFPAGTMLIILGEDGEYLLMRTSRLLKLSGLSVERRCEALSALMKKNDIVKLGRYVGSDDVHFEVSIWLNDEAEMTEGQFARALSVTYSCLETVDDLRSEILQTAEPVKDSVLAEFPAIRRRLKPPQN